jgi:predicted LPLAT superfamily acyltransferase
LQPGWRTSFRHFIELGQVMLDKVLIFSGGITLKDITAHAREVMNDRVKRGEGGVVLTAHVGNLEAMQALSEDNQNLRLTILVHTKHAESFNRVLEKAKPRRKPTLIEVTDFSPDLALKLADRVAKGEWIVVAADRVPVSSDRSVDANFLGARAPFPAGPHVLAGVLGCPMVFVVSLKQGDRYHVHYELLTERLEWSRSTRNEVVAGSVQKFADRLSHYCEIAPLQWFNFFPFWHQS